jgi:hypothetical protein
MFRRDYAEAVRGFHADALWSNTAEFPGPRCCLGPQAIMDFWTTLMEDVDIDQQEVERAITNESAVVVGVHSVGRAVRSGIAADVRWAAAFQLRDGLISRVDVYGNWQKALAATGLSE